MSRENLLRAWQKFSRGKWRQRAVQHFWMNLEPELTQLYHEVAEGRYRHGPYRHFTVHDTKRRDIYVAAVRDRVVHQMLSDHLARIYGRRFIAHSYAAQKGKGVSAARAYALDAIRRLQSRGAVWIGKLDVEKYFANIDHAILLQLLERRIDEPRIFALCARVIESFGNDGRGMPLGNLTSQWFANIYLHELDWHAKHMLRIPYYMRYNDDVILIDAAEQRIRSWVTAIVQWTHARLKLSIPAHKIQICAVPGSVVDVLGVCTDGVRQWIRLVTEKRAQQNLWHAYRMQKATLFDIKCAYYGNGITHALADTDGTLI